MSAPCGTSLMTRGVITSGGLAEQVVSLNNPLMRATVELRPHIRGAAAPVDMAAPPIPSVRTAQELRPVLAAQAAQEPSPHPAPSITSAQELAPIITDAEEE